MASALVRIGSRSRQPGGVNVGRLDSDDAQTLALVRGRGEAPPGDAAVENGVRGEFGDDQDDRVVCLGAVRVAPTRIAGAR
ncbi:hypothetical protein [Streptomyces sp. NPDC102437]|uniref:hypothetical protein n=1 Tax=Streptomyces sp. NPDC102437 TaxID=3366175 RepID=UPI003828FA8F